MSQKTIKPVQQKQITDIQQATPVKLPEKIELEKPNPQQQQKATIIQPKNQPEKPMPDEVKIIANFLAEFEDICWAARNKLYQLYGPIDYTSPASIATQFTEEQEANLNFESQGEYWIIKTKRRLEPEMFSAICAKVRELSGEYISAGKESHFKVRKA